MSLSSIEIKFQKPTDQFFNYLYHKIKDYLSAESIKKARRKLWLKLSVYGSFFILSYLLVITNIVGSNFGLFIPLYATIGFTGIMLAFNTSHDAVHNTLSDNKIINAVIYHITFNLQGVNARLWEMRHIASHHIFPNVDGCDADIDNNPIIRLSPSHSYHWWNKYQHIYATFLYCIYTLVWILLKDILYLKKKNLANLKDIKHPYWVTLELIAWKMVYFTYMIAIPVLVTPYSLGQIIIAFLIMHAFISLFFIFTLIMTHYCEETDFPEYDERGNLPYNYYEHQLAVSLDYHPTSPIANWIFGGFNSHSAHHLFPGVPHTLYTKLTPHIQDAAKKFNYAYNELPLGKAILSHFKYLKRLGKPQNEISNVKSKLVTS